MALSNQRKRDHVLMKVATALIASEIKIRALIFAIPLILKFSFQ